MIVALDVQYTKRNGASAAAVAFSEWNDELPAHEWTVAVKKVDPYVSGQFYRRELPCLQAVLNVAPCQVELVIVDGHVWLEPGRPGLGHYLHLAFEKRFPVIGVAKRRFVNGAAAEVLRGQSRKPLYVTAIDMDRAAAAAHVQSMHGPFRIPTVLKMADSLARNSASYL